MVNGKKKILIVGSGMAGLTAAAYLAKENYDVLLLDKNDRCGGLVHTIDQNGFSFDTGPRAFVNSGMVKPMLKDLGVDWEFLENKISIGIEDYLFSVESMDSLRRISANSGKIISGEASVILKTSYLQFKNYLNIPEFYTNLTTRISGMS